MSPLTPGDQPGEPWQPAQGVAQPKPLTPQQLAAIPKSSVKPPPVSGGQPAHPVVTPPSAPGQAAPLLMPRSAGSGGGGGTNWLNNIQILALWSINQDRNVYVNIANIGWVKLSNASESGIIALSILAQYAKQSQEYVTCRQEADGMIHEILA